MARLAAAFKKSDDAREFTTKADRVYETFNTAFLDLARPPPDKHPAAPGLFL